MVTIPVLLDRCTRSFVLLSRNGHKLRAEVLFPEAYPLTPNLAALLGEHKQQVLAYLDFEVEADALLLESTRRLAAAWPSGCDALDHDAAWREFEEETRRAYWTLDLPRLRKTIAAREAYAMQMFESFRREGQL